MEFPFRLHIAKANCAESTTEYFVWEDAVLPMLVDVRENRPGWASISDEELRCAEEGYCIAASSVFDVNQIYRLQYREFQIMMRNMAAQAVK